MKKRVPVSQIMSTELITLDLSQSLYDAERLFKKHNIRHLPVVDGKKLIGVLSYSDLLKISYADLTENEENVSEVVYDMYTIQQVMAKVPISVEPETSIKEVAEVLADQSFHSIPITDGEELVGIVTTTDLLNYFLSQY